MSRCCCDGLELLEQEARKILSEFGTRAITMGEARQKLRWLFRRDEFVEASSYSQKVFQKFVSVIEKAIVEEALERRFV